MVSQRLDMSCRGGMASKIEVLFQSREMRNFFSHGWVPVCQNYSRSNIAVTIAVVMLMPVYLSALGTNISAS